MDRIKQLIWMLVNVGLLIALLLQLSHGGVGMVLGDVLVKLLKVVVEFGVSVISITGIVLGIMLPTQRHRQLRNAQLQSMKYIVVLLLFQILMWFIGGAVGGLGGNLLQKLPPTIINVVGFSFMMIAFMMPFNFVKYGFNQLKAVEERNPHQFMRQLFGTKK